MHKGLAALRLDLSQSDIFITHLHADHFGLVSKLTTDSTNILFSRPEKELMESWEGFGAMVDYAARSGFPENELEAALDKHPGAKYGADWVPELKILDDGDFIDVGDYHFKCVTTPGHTLGMVNFHFAQSGVVFTGDTLFALGCGRIFEGDPAMMWASLQKLMELPPETLVYCGHEYTQANAKFSVTVDPDNSDLAARAKEIEALRAEGKPTLPTTIGKELETNPFLRAADPAIRAHLKMEAATDAEVFAEIRKRKDNA